MTMVFLLSHQRSGSHFLKDTLDCHNSHLRESDLSLLRYRALPEVLLPDLDRNHPNVATWSFARYLRERVAQAPETWGNPEGIATAALQFFDYLEEKAQSETLLVDIKLNQLHIAEGWFHTTEACPRLLRHLATKGKFLFLRRRNVVRAVLSGLLAKRNGIWHVRGAHATVPEHSPLELHCRQFLAAVEQMDRGLSAAERWFENWSGRTLKVHYEDLFDQAEATCNTPVFDRIAQFTGLAAGANWETKMKKLGTYAVRDVVTNYDELCATLESTPYAAMLEDQAAPACQHAHAA